MPMSKEEFLAGKETNKVSIDEESILSLFGDGQYYPTKEVTAHVFGDDAGQSKNEVILTKLKALEKEGRITGKKIGMGFVWGLPAGS